MRQMETVVEPEPECVPETITTFIRWSGLKEVFRGVDRNGKPKRERLA